MLQIDTEAEKVIRNQLVVAEVLFRALVDHGVVLVVRSGGLAAAPFRAFPCCNTTKTRYNSPSVFPELIWGILKTLKHMR